MSSYIKEELNSAEKCVNSFKKIYFPLCLIKKSNQISDNRNCWQQLLRKANSFSEMKNIIVLPFVK